MHISIKNTLIEGLKLVVVIVTLGVPIIIWAMIDTERQWKKKDGRVKNYDGL
jgi:hypothetical protein